MGALATNKSTHLSMVVPMTAYALCTAFCYYVLFEERRHTVPRSLDKDAQELDISEEILRPTIGFPENKFSTKNIRGDKGDQ
jgi:hypothetical protein